MRKVMRVAVLALAIVLIATGIYFVLRKDDAPQQGGSSAALGMMMLEQEKGLYVLAVTQDSPADRAGIRTGDYLLRLGEDQLQDMPQLDALIDAAREPLSLVTRREEKELRLQLPVR